VRRKNFEEIADNCFRLKSKTVIFQKSNSETLAIDHRLISPHFYNSKAALGKNIFSLTLAES
jgi:hypothetical protein